MSRRAHLGLIVCLTAILLAGCGSDSTNNSQEDQATTVPGADTSTQQPSDDGPAGDPIEVVFASGIWEQAGRGENIWNVVAGFNDAQDEVVVSQLSIPFSSYRQEIFTQLGAGGGPDLIFFNETEMFEAMDAGFVEPLDDLVDSSAFADDLVAQNDLVVSDGARYGYIFETNQYALIYNEQLFDDAGIAAPPTTFDEFVETGMALTSPPDQYGFAYRHTLDQTAGWWFDLTNFVYGFGGRWSTGDGQPTINTPEVVEAVEAYATVLQSGIVPEGADASTYRQMAWNNGIGMMVDNSAVPPILVSENADIAEHLAAAPIPFPEPEHAAIVTFVAINANGEHKAEAAQVIEYMLQESTQVELLTAMQTGVATSIEPSTELLEAAPWIPGFQDVADSGMLVVPADFRSSFGEFQTIVIEEVAQVLAGSKTAQEALDAAQERVSSELTG